MGLPWCSWPINDESKRVRITHRPLNDFFVKWWAYATDIASETGETMPVSPAFLKLSLSFMSTLRSLVGACIVLPSGVLFMGPASG